MYYNWTKVCEYKRIGLTVPVDHLTSEHCILSPEMQSFICITAVLLSFGQYSVATFEAQEATCGLKYQDILKDAVNLRKRCDNAAYQDCCQIKHFDPAAISGPYELFHLCETRPLNFGVTKVYASCDMEADEGGWVVIMRRFNGSVDFNRTLEEYEYGFGDIAGEFWYGLKNIHCLTNREPVQLRIEIGNGTEPSIVWEYQTFSIATGPYYQLTIGAGKGIGDTYDAFYQHRNQYFYTYDRDGYSCGKNYGAGWWYYPRSSICHYGNLNGKYEPPGAPAKSKLSWYTTTPGGYAHYTHVTMKVRPKSCAPCVV